jgi:hypothetical protein
MYICNMNQEQAIVILEQALNQATQKGAFNLNEVSQILQALSVLNSTDKK